MFDFDYMSSIWLYGYSQFDLVKNKYEEMIKLGYQVKGYIDQNADALKHNMRVPCWTLDTIPINKEERGDTIIVLLLQNGQIHKKIALELQDQGFSKILFIPPELTSKEQKRMCMLYNSFLHGNYDQLKDIPEVGEVSKGELVERQILPKDENTKIVFMPTDILFMYQKDNDTLRCNVGYDTIYFDLYDYLEGRKDDCIEYLRFMGVKTEEEKSRLLNDRRSLYYKFQYEYNLQSDYFIQTAASVRWNDNGYFNIIDGHHRVEFLVYKGYRCIPVHVSENDYVLWKNKNVLEQYEYWQNVRCPVPNPQFLGRSIFYRSIWNEVMGYLYTKIIKKGTTMFSFLEVDAYDGYFARLCALFGWSKSYVGTQDTTQKQVCTQLNRLLYQDNVTVLDYAEIEKKRIEVVYVNSSMVGIKGIEKILSKNECKHLIVEVEITMKDIILEILKKRFHKKPFFVGVSNDQQIVYGIGEEKWQK